jgi:hypothetical protein
MPAVAAKVLIEIVRENVFSIRVCDSSSYMILLSRIIYAGSACSL